LFQAKPEDRLNLINSSDEDIPGEPAAGAKQHPDGDGAAGGVPRLVRPERNVFDTIAGFTWGLVNGDTPLDNVDEAVRPSL